MLKVDDLKSQIKSGLSNIIPTAIESCKLQEWGQDSIKAKEKAKEFADNFDELVSEQLAEVLANAIDYYIKNADITGTIITAGGCFSQMARISAPGSPIIGGKVPNTFGIS